MQDSHAPENIFRWKVRDDDTSAVEILGFDDRVDLSCPSELIVPEAIDGKRVVAIGERAFSDCFTPTSIALPEGLTTIGARAFYGCFSVEEFIVSPQNQAYRSLDGVLFSKDEKRLIAYPPRRRASVYDVPDSAESIDEGAFAYSSSLTAIKLPERITQIGASAFSNCSSLKEISLPEGLTALGYRAFSRCSSLTSIHLPEGMTTIGDSAFEDCSSLTSIDLPEGLTALGDRAFWGCCRLTSIELPEELTTIGESAFSFCSSLTSIHLPKGLTTIGESAFKGCFSLTAINLPVGLTTIGDRAFESCSSLTSIRLPEKLGKIGENAFSEIPDDCVFHVPAGSYAHRWAIERGYEPRLIKERNAQMQDSHAHEKIFRWKVRDDDPNAVEILGFDEDRIDLIYPSELIVPETIDGKRVVAIGERAFSYCSTSTSIALPEGLTTIGARAFYGCSSVEEFIVSPQNQAYCALDGVLFSKDEKRVIAYPSGSRASVYEVPGGAETIDSGAFFGCSFLKEFIVSPQNQAYCALDGVLFSKDGKRMIAYPSGRRASVYDVPDSAEIIGPGAFSCCLSLTAIRMPEGVTSIGDDAFSRCSSLKAIDLSEELTQIGETAFFECSALTAIRLPEGLTTIGKSAFYGCSSLTAIHLPKGLTTIGEFAFFDCSSLNEFTVSPQNQAYRSLDGVLFSKDGMRLIAYPPGRCASVYDVPDSAASIDANAFYRCSSLTEIHLPKGLTTIDDSAFEDCSALTEIHLPDGLATIGDNAFYDCSSLTAINLPDGLATIGRYAFSSCSSLTAIHLPNGLTTIGKSAFSCCFALTAIRLPDGLEEISDDAFFGCSSLTAIQLPNGLKTIGKSAFSGCSSLTSFHLPEGLTTIGADAFYGCSSLKEFTVSPQNQAYRSLDGVLFSKDEKRLIAYPPRRRASVYDVPHSAETIDESAFAYSSSLTAIKLPERITQIGASTFSNCSLLKEISLPDALKTIDDHAFFGCSSLQYIRLPKNLAKIGADAFSYCLLSSIDLPERLTEIGENAFCGCQFFEKFTVSPLNQAYRSIDGVLFSMDGKRLIVYPPGRCALNYDVPDSVETINAKAFFFCDLLRSIRLPKALTAIGESAFMNCSSLTSIDLPERLASIGECAFEKCFSLTSIRLPEKLGMIGENAFSEIPDDCVFRVPAGSYAYRWTIEHGCNVKIRRRD